MNSEPTVIADPDLALWASALLRDRKRALLRLWEISGGQDMHAAAPRAARLVHAELDREARVRAGRPVERDDWIGRILAARDRRRKRREPATRRRWAIMMRAPACRWVPPPWWGVADGREPEPYDVGVEWAAFMGAACPQ